MLGIDLSQHIRHGPHILPLVCAPHKLGEGDGSFTTVEVRGTQLGGEPSTFGVDTLIARLSGISNSSRTFITIFVSCVGSQNLIQGIASAIRMICLSIPSDCKSPMSNHLKWESTSCMMRVCIATTHSIYPAVCHLLKRSSCRLTALGHAIGPRFP